MMQTLEKVASSQKSISCQLCKCFLGKPLS